ncbi:hypothetical protein SANTM175S_05728 [Streptomyces antimycoticus]
MLLGPGQAVDGQLERVGVLERPVFQSTIS